MTDPRTNRFVRSHVKTRHLVLLVELGRHRSILRAAQAANLTQPAASKLLAELEHALGVTLFERLPRGVQPTRYGEVLIRRAGAALAELSAAHQEVAELADGLSGRISLGTVMTPAIGLVPEAVLKLKQAHARVQVSITVDTSKALIQQLREGRHDIVISRILDSESAAELNFEPLTDEPHSLIVRAGHPLLKRSALALPDLAAQAWVMPSPGSILRDRLTALFLSQGVPEPQEIVETTAVPCITQLLLASDMVTALPPELVQEQLDAGHLATLPLELGLRMDLYGIVTRKHHQLAPGPAVLLDLLREGGRQRYGAASTSSAAYTKLG
ncbi:LysR substrate-binding domain-containing protein [Roseateles sp.]|uniref:LysR substrate-binding domain-containing protein n=1 Tax=Roseateles sp. TaxID=1971397 RepID=UPI003930BF4D